jgi:hypothetical protein
MRHKPAPQVVIGQDGTSGLLRENPGLRPAREGGGSTGDTHPTVIVCRWWCISTCQSGCSYAPGWSAAPFRACGRASPPAAARERVLGPNLHASPGSLCHICHDLPRLRACNFGPKPRSTDWGLLGLALGFALSVGDLGVGFPPLALSAACPQVPGRGRGSGVALRRGWWVTGSGLVRPWWRAARRRGARG